MDEKLTLKRLAEIRGNVNSREANAVTDADADWTPIRTTLLRQIIKVAEKGLQSEELARVGRTIAYLAAEGRLDLDEDTKRELDTALEPFAKPPKLHVVQEEPAPSV